MFDGTSTAHELSAVCGSRPVTETRDESWSSGLMVLAGGFADRLGFDRRTGVFMPAGRRSFGEPRRPR
jgi:hypothetical protein